MQLRRRRFECQDIFEVADGTFEEATFCSVFVADKSLIVFLAYGHVYPTPNKRNPKNSWVRLHNYEPDPRFGHHSRCGMGLRICTVEIITLFSQHQFILLMI